MTDASPFRRKWRVTVLRGVVALALAFGVAAWFAYSGSGGEWISLAYVGQVFIALIAAPTAWLVPFGAYADHRLSSSGMGITTLVHAVGGVLGLFLAMAYFAIGAALAGAQGPGEYGFLFVIFVPLWMVAGCLAAWLVPGSFPPRRARVANDVAGIPPV